MYLGVIAHLFQLLDGLHDHVAHAGVAEDGDVLARAHQLGLLQRLVVPLLRLPCDMKGLLSLQHQYNNLCLPGGSTDMSQLTFCSSWLQSACGLHYKPNLSVIL